MVYKGWGQLLLKSNCAIDRRQPTFELGIAHVLVTRCPPGVNTYHENHLYVQLQNWVGLRRVPQAHPGRPVFAFVASFSSAVEGERELSPPHHPPEQLREMGMEGRDGERKEGKTKGEGESSIKGRVSITLRSSKRSTYLVLLNFH